MKTRACAVCGKIDTVDKFGKGIRCPKTTCLNCKRKIVEFAETKAVMLVKRITRGETE